MIVHAGLLVTMDGPPIADAALRIEGNRICALAHRDSLPPAPGEHVVDLRDHIVLPGLINAHCHLDYSMMRGAISPPKSFTAWVQRINALKRSLDADDYLAAIQRGIAEAKRWGTTSVANIEAFPELMPRIPPAPLRIWWFYEMIDVRHRITTEDVVAGALSFFNQQAPGGETGGGGLSPHAPYTASRTLYGLAAECSRKLSMPVCTHLAESREEFAMFHDGSGPLHDFLRDIGRPMEDCGHKQTPFAHLWHTGSIDHSWILVHMNELTEDDFALLETAPTERRPHIVHCPGSHSYFNHSPFAFRRLQSLGINLCVGTDSLASTDSLSLLRELRRLQTTEPSLSARELLETVTLNPARALQRQGQLGALTLGACADLIALPSPHKVSELAYDSVLACTEPVHWMMIDGKIVA